MIDRASLRRRHSSPARPRQRTLSVGASERRTEKPGDYSFASFGITSALNSCSERSASASDMVPRNR